MSAVLITGARAPVALHLARELHVAGRRVLLADTLRFPMSRATRTAASYFCWYLSCEPSAEISARRMQSAFLNGEPLS